MNRSRAGFLVATAIAVVVMPLQAHAWGAAGYRGVAAGGGGSGAAYGRYGGSASWNHGSGSATDARGGSASWNRSAGTATATTAYGGSATYNRSSGTTTATSAYGNTATWNHNTYYAHPPAGAYYRPPVYHPVPVYGAPAYYNNGYNATTGEVAAAGVAGLAVGAMVGSAKAKSQQQSTAASTAPPTTISSPLPMGTQLSSLPAGCTNAVVKSVEYYGCGPNWFKPVFGGGGVYYQVVPQPF
jgi:hypothetical protein